MSDYYQAFDNLDTGVGSDPFNSNSRREVHLQPLGALCTVSSAEASRYSRGLEYPPFDNVSFGFPELLPMLNDASTFEPRDTVADAVNTNHVDVNEQYLGGMEGFPIFSPASDLPAIPLDPALQEDMSQLMQQIPSITDNRFILEMPSDAQRSVSSPIDEPVDAPQLSPSAFESNATSLSTTPEPLTPSSSVHSLSPPLIDEQSIASTLGTPPCLAGPSSPPGEYNRVEGLTSGKGKSKASVPSAHQATDGNSSTINDVSSDGVSPSMLLPDVYFTIQRPSSAGPSRRVAEPRKVNRSSKSQSTHVDSGEEEHSKTTRTACTVFGCRLTFYDARTRDRHVRHVHGDDPWFCPGGCKKDGFSRRDALNRHLKTRPTDSECVVQAKILGWCRDTKGSTQRLRCVGPSM